MMSSDTSFPESMIFLAANPSGVPAFTAARSMSPVEICGMPKRRLMQAACVPFPAPGGPRSTSLIVRVSWFGSAPAWIPEERQKLPVMPCLVKQSADSLQVFGSIDPGHRCVRADADSYGEPVPQGAQLLERLEALQRRQLQARVSTQKTGAISIDADVPVTRKTRRQRGRGCRKRIPGPGYG